MPRFVKPPTPAEWAAAAAKTLRENGLTADVTDGPSGSTRLRFAAEGRAAAACDVWPSLKVAASGPQAVRDAALEVLAGAGYLDGARAGATGGMRATMPAPLEDAPNLDPYLHLILTGTPPPGEDPQPAAGLPVKAIPRGMTGGPSGPAEGRTLRRTRAATPADGSLGAALRTLREMPASKRPPSTGERLRAWRDELRAGPAVGHNIAAEIERRFPEAFDEETP